MTDQRWFLVVFFLFSLCYFGHSDALLPRYDSHMIESLDIEIADCCQPSFQDIESVRSRLKTREGDLFSQLTFDNDLKILSQDFDHVEPNVTMVEDRVRIYLKVWLKPTIRSINWHGNCKLKTCDLQKELGISSCSVFDRICFNRAFQKLKSYYVKEGYFEAELEYDIQEDSSCNAVDIDIYIIEGRTGKIGKIHICNFTCEEKECIEELMVSKEYVPILSWFTSEGYYHEEAAQHDSVIIQNYLQNRGFADAIVSVDMADSKRCDRVDLIVSAERGNRYHFGEVTFEGNCLFTEEQLRCKFTFSPGDPFSPEEIRNTVMALTDLYGRYGYIETFINFEPKLDCESLSYSIHVKIEEGDQYRVGLIKVFGNCTTETTVILHETLLIPGEVFNIEKLKATEVRLQNIGYFKCVNVYAVKSDTLTELCGNYRDVHIEVEETSTGNFGAFGGFSTVESMFIGFSVTERNFNHNGLCKLFSEGYGALRGGGEYAHFTTTLGLRSRRYVFSWTKPHFLDTPWIVGFDIENSSNRYISKDYDIEATGITLHAAYQANAFVRTGWHYRLRNTYVKVPGSASCRLREEAKNSGLISAVGVFWNYDSSDHPTCPTSGFKSRLEGEFAGVGGDSTFFGLAYLNSYYFPIGFKGGVLKLRGDVRFLVPFGHTTANEMPLDERLFLGGDNTIRGYRAYRLGPQYREGDPRGGVSMQLFSAEYAFNLFKRVDGFLFTDAGHLSMKTFNFGRLSTSVGFGTRIKLFDSTPPLTVGMGFPVNARDRGEVKRFFLTVGSRF